MGISDTCTEQSGRQKKRGRGRPPHGSAPICDVFVSRERKRAKKPFDRNADAANFGRRKKYSMPSSPSLNFPHCQAQREHNFPHLVSPFDPCRGGEGRRRGVDTFVRGGNKPFDKNRRTDQKSRADKAVLCFFFSIFQRSLLSYFFRGKLVAKYKTSNISI